jgi:hypothetical protein
VSMGIYFHPYTSQMSIVENRITVTIEHSLVMLFLVSLLVERLDIEFGTQRNDSLGIVLGMRVEVVFLDI